jgi:hypothetical protein
MPDDFAQFRVLVFFQQQIHERLDGNHAILDLVRHAGRQHPEVGQPVQPLHLFRRSQRGSPRGGRGQIPGLV